MVAYRTKRTCKIRCLLLSLLFILSGVLCGCAPEHTTETVYEATIENQLEIGMTFDAFVLERWQRDRDIFVSMVEELGATVNVQCANGDVKEQEKQIDYFIEKKVDAIVVVQVADEGNEIQEAIQRAKKAGIPVVAYDRLVSKANVDLYISFDNEAVGYLMGEHIRYHIGTEGDLLEIYGPLADNNVPQIMAGVDRVLDGTDIVVKQTEHAEGWHIETGFSVTSSYLDESEKPDAIICGNDGVAGQAIRALAERRIAGDVCVVGQDADLDACQRIVEGTQCMTVYKPIEQLAKRAAEMTVQLAKKETIETTDTIHDGAYEVPYEKIRPIAVNKDNMDQVITDKYHSREDVYLNVHPKESE